MVEFLRHPHVAFAAVLALFHHKLHISQHLEVAGRVAISQDEGSGQPGSDRAGRIYGLTALLTVDGHRAQYLKVVDFGILSVMEFQARLYQGRVA